jgi:hypothetical protein
MGRDEKDDMIMNLEGVISDMEKGVSDEIAINTIKRVAKQIAAYKPTDITDIDYGILLREAKRRNVFNSSVYLEYVSNSELQSEADDRGMFEDKDEDDNLISLDDEQRIYLAKMLEDAAPGSFDYNLRNTLLGLGG